MEKQILAIHGGASYATYEKYIADLKTMPIDFEKVRGKVKKWRLNLGERLGEEYDVISPQMPNARNSRYLEWKIWLERILPFLNEEIILIGHSLGGVFLAKYLAEEKIAKKVKAIFFVATPFFKDIEEDFVDFVLPKDLQGINQAEKVFFFNSEDDQIVLISEMEEYRKVLPTATFKIFKDRGHFNQENFPELEEEIKKMT